MPEPPRRDYRAMRTPMAVESQRAREAVAMVKRRLPSPSVMSGTVTAWNGDAGTAFVMVDDSADEESPETREAESHIGVVMVGERVWLHTISDATYITGRGVGMTWQSVQNSENGGWFPQGRLSTNPTVRNLKPDGTPADPVLGAGGIAQAGFNVRQGLVSMTYTIQIGTGATNLPGGTGVGIWALPLPIAIAGNFGWDLANRSWVGGSCLFFDGVDYMGTHLSAPGRDFVELRISSPTSIGKSLQRTNWPNGNGNTPLVGTVIAGTFQYPGAE